jgi:hypothetical protein
MSIQKGDHAMTTGPPAATRPAPSRTISPGRDRVLAWLYIGIAYVLGALIVLGWSSMSGHRIQNEEDAAVFSTGISLLVLLLGLPALILLWRALIRSSRAARSEETSRHHRALIVATVPFFAAAVVGVVVLQSQLQQGKSQAADHATASVYDRSGLVVIARGNQRYRNMNDRCSGMVSGPPPVLARCGPENRPTCVTRQWLATRNAWPLVQIGEARADVPMSQGSRPGASFSSGPLSPILRPSSQDTTPSMLLVTHGGCYLLYRRMA